MFDFFDTSKLLIIGIIALLVIPPKDLPSVLRQVGQAVGKLRRMATEFQNQFKDALAEAEIDMLKKDLQAVSDSAKLELDAALGNSIQSPQTSTVESAVATVESAPVLEPAPSPEAMLGDKPKKKRVAAKKGVKADV